nr:hypothetical protein [Bacillus pumilus]
MLIAERLQCCLFFFRTVLICLFFLWSLYTLMSAGPEPLAVLGVYTLPILMLSSITGLNPTDKRHY